MSRNLYKNYLLLCQKWGTDPTKKGRDLGEFIRQEVAKEFPIGDLTQVRGVIECEKKLQSLQRLVANTYKTKYPTKNIVGATWMSLEECKILISTEALQEIEEQSFTNRLKISVSEFKEKYFNKKADN